MREWLFEHLSMAALEALFLAGGLLALVYVSYSLRDGLAELSPPVARRLGWQRSLFLLPVSLIPFWNTALGFLLIPVVLAVAAFQVERLWLVRAAGSEAYLTFLRQAALRSSPRAAVLCNLGSAFLVAASAGALWLVSPDPGEDWGYWFALGLGMYALINGYERSRAAVRVFKSLPPAGAT